MYSYKDLFKKDWNSSSLTVLWNQFPRIAIKTCLKRIETGLISTKPNIIAMRYSYKDLLKKDWNIVIRYHDGDRIVYSYKDLFKKDWNLYLNYSNHAANLSYSYKDLFKKDWNKATTNTHRQRKLYSYKDLFKKDETLFRTIYFHCNKIV